jgi:hypothetical protein
LELTLLIGLHRLPDAAGGADRHLEACGGKHLKGVGPAVAGDDSLNPLPGNGLGGLDACASGRAHGRVLDCLELHALAVDNQQVLAPPEPGVEVSVKVRPRR